jgi:tetratricopeptide (TPR) repeat protein
LAGDDTAAVPHLVAAAADARAVAALAEAVAYLEEALEIAPGRADEWLELGEVEAWRGRREQSEAAFARAFDLLADADRLVLARALLTQAAAYHGPICVPRGTLDSARKALTLLDEDALQERGEALAACAWAEAVAGSVDEAERLLAELSSVAPQADDRRTYDAGHARGQALIRRGRFTDAYGPLIAAGQASERLGRPDLTYGCWANAASAATAAGEPDRALEFLDRCLEAIAGKGLRGIEIHLHGARAFVLRGLGRLDEAFAETIQQATLAEQLGEPGMEAMASHDRGLVALAAGEHEAAAELLSASLVEGAPISRPLTRLSLAEALTRTGRTEAATEQVRATVLEPLQPSDFPDALVPRLARVQALIALARGESDEAGRRFDESITGWERLIARGVKADSITTVLTDLGRPVVGLVEPERELAKVQAELANALVS